MATIRKTHSRDRHGMEHMRRAPSQDHGENHQHIGHTISIDRTDSGDHLHHNMASPMALHISPVNSSGSGSDLEYASPILSPAQHHSSIMRQRPSFWQRIVTGARHHPDALYIGISLAAWYLVGVLAICTTKLLLSTPLEEGGVPSPIILTFQQMGVGSMVFLRSFLWFRGSLQKWPQEEVEKTKSHAAPQFRWWNLRSYTVLVDFLLLAGLFNGLDFLASNTSFSKSSASFVETIKASEPITTTALALWWGVDRLGKMEAGALTILISGVLISTYANAMANAGSSDTTTTNVDDDAASSLQDSIKTCLTVLTANLCFAFRGLCQKMLRNSANGSAKHLDDFNLLFRMQQTGAASLLLPVLLFQHKKLVYILWYGRPTWKIWGHYVGLSLVNAWALTTYCLASCYILSRISVVQHSGFGCLRRLFAICVTSVAFGVPISPLGGVGIFMSIVGFSAFTHFRFQRQGQNKKDVVVDNSDVARLLPTTTNGSHDDIIITSGSQDHHTKDDMVRLSPTNSRGTDTAPPSLSSSGSSSDNMLQQLQQQP